MSWWRARLRLPANSRATTRAAKWVFSSEATCTSAPGSPARISRATSSGFMGAILHGPLQGAPIMSRWIRRPPPLSPPRPRTSSCWPRRAAAFARACRICLNCQGRVVVTGMGKSGHVAGKIAATLASTGTPAFFLHPAEAGHGDLGMITRSDAVLALSNSGETPELVMLLPHLKRLGVPLMVLSGRPDSTLGRAATVLLDVAVDEEACPLNLAPTASTTATLAMGDALAVAVLEARGFTEADFAR